MDLTKYPVCEYLYPDESAASLSAHWFLWLLMNDIAIFCILTSATLLISVKRPIKIIIDCILGLYFGDILQKIIDHYTYLNISNEFNSLDLFIIISVALYSYGLPSKKLRRWMNS